MIFLGLDTLDTLSQNQVARPLIVQMKSDLGDNWLFPTWGAALPGPLSKFRH